VGWKKLEELVAKTTKRKRTPLQIKTLAIFLYFNGLSLRAISQVLDYFGLPVS
jgi:transposase-like protein